MTEQLIGQLGYLGIVLILILGGLGLPIPEEAPIFLAAILSKNGQLHWPLALSSCLAGVLLGDLVVYFLGFFYGEKVLRLPLTRRLLTRQREAQIKGYFHRHGYKMLVLGRFAPGFRTAAYLTAGILKLPTLKLLVTDVVAASLTTFLMFGLGYAFAYQIQSGIREAQQWVTVIAAVGMAAFLLVRFYRARRRSGLPVGPPVLETDEVSLPPDDLRIAPSSSDVAVRPDGGAPDPVPAVDSTKGVQPAETTALTHGDPMNADGADLGLGPGAAARPSHEPLIIDLDAAQPHSSIKSPSR